jgi:tripartite-type tricarboxylate transporter receptor subunit TctC
MIRRIPLRAAGAALLLFCSAPLHAQTYPDRPVKIIVPTVAAGTVDLVTRVMANDLGTVLGKQFFIENRSGAGNTLGSRDVAHQRELAVIGRGDPEVAKCQRSGDVECRGVEGRNTYSLE